MTTMKEMWNNFKLRCRRREHEADLIDVEDRKPRYRHGKALLVGINYYGTDAKLNGCINDVKNMYHYLTTIENFDPKNIRILTDEPHNFEEDRPTRDNITREIEWLVDVPSNDDRKTSLFMHYSGHGSWVWDRKSDEKDRRDETICPVDYHESGLMKDDELRKILVDPLKNKANVKLTCLFDCCHSGTILDLRYDIKVTRNPREPQEKLFKIDENKRYGKGKAEIVLFSGCMDKQYSADAFINRKAQGAMTYGYLFMIKSFKRSRRKLTYKKFIADLQKLLKDSNYDQIPQLSMNHCPKLKSVYGV